MDSNLERDAERAFAPDPPIGGIGSIAIDADRWRDRFQWEGEIGEQRPAIGRWLSVRFVRAFPVVSPGIPCRPMASSETPAELARGRKREREKEAGACSLSTTGSLLIIVIGAHETVNRFTARRGRLLAPSER